MAWVTVPDSDVDPESPITTGLMIALRDNPVAIAGRLSGAPLVVNANSVFDQGANNEEVKLRILEIGDWDMVATLNVQIAHGLTADNIRLVSAVIRGDSGVNNFYPIGTQGSNALPVGDAFILAWDVNNVGMQRVVGGLFDSVSFNQTSYNRGWITIWYAEP